MQKIFNSREVVELEAQLVDERSDWEGVSELIAHKSIAVCNRIKQDFLLNRRAVVFAGPNEKGALAIKVAQSLLGMQYDIEVVLLNPSGNLPTEVAMERDDFLEESDRLIEVTTNSFNPPTIDETDLLIDGIQGVEPNPSLNNVVKYLNGIKAIKIALEIPSGMSDVSDELIDYTKIFRADATYTFYSPRLLFFFPEYEPYVGRWRVLQPSFYTPQSKSDATYMIFDTQSMESVLPMRRRFSNKYDYGRDLLIAGSRSMMGAALLAGKAAMVSGAGHLTLRVPMGTNFIIHTSLPEALVSEDPSEESFSSASLPLADYTAIAVGPGIGRSTETRLALEQLLSSYKLPLLLDADALALLADDEGRLLDMVPKGSILTPHVGEFDRLFGPSKNSRERIEKLRTAAEERGLYILLKGAYTATALPTGQVVFNLTGNPGLATAGSGDVLTGIILALMGKKQGQMIACAAGAFLHGFAAENFAADYCEESLTASALVQYLPTAFKRFTSDSVGALYL
ncbi:Bifunctional NAD(P)H-hydrate repair enzyme Nnr [Porphyromonas levii]|uniref:NAD(P)H-hydrate dehydratase n=1 Tax=Porphyromonas levii TaxID=28114 RepID=UPI001B8D036E|nr:NAD(P)H-hydrate dehydratase [Porphyromonas levii]MBR8731655.1 Bifunctional NAD(P)H-hydrate repair enzyme Nnr [Porphyromonas levii]